MLKCQQLLAFLLFISMINTTSESLKARKVYFYPQMKSEGYSFGVVCSSVSASFPSVCPSTLFVCLEPYLTIYWSDLIHSWYLTGVTALWSLSKTHLSWLSTGSTQEDPSRITERLLSGRKESNQTNKHSWYE